MSWYGAQTQQTLESDEELRARLFYVAGDGEWLTRTIAAAGGERLDEIASCYNLKRRAA